MQYTLAVGFTSTDDKGVQHSHVVNGVYPTREIAEARGREIAKELTGMFTVDYISIAAWGIEIVPQAANED